MILSVNKYPEEEEEEEYGELKRLEEGVDEVITYSPSITVITSTEYLQ